MCTYPSSSPSEDINKRVRQKIDDARNNPKLGNIADDLDILEIELESLNRIRLKEHIKSLTSILKIKIEENDSLREVLGLKKQIIKSQEEEINSLKQQLEK